MKNTQANRTRGRRSGALCLGAALLILPPGAVPFAWALLGAALFSSCGKPQTSDIKVNSSADPKANFAGYKSYDWYENVGLLRDETGTWTPKDTDALAKVESLVDKKMRERGMIASEAEPDLLVSLLMVANVDQVEKIQHARGGAVAPVDTVGQGALVIELIDAATGKTVWLGGAKGEVRQSRSVEEGNERLTYAVDQLFDRVPR